MSWDIFSKSKIQYFLEKLKGKFVQKETGKGLSSNDYTTTDKNKVALIDNTTTSATGNPISIADLKSAQIALNPVITFEPIQDLHGQSKPYPAGGGKNKAPLVLDKLKAINFGTWSGNVYTYGGGTFTVQTDSAGNITGILVNGTFTNNTVFYIANSSEEYFATVANKTVILNGCPSGGSVSTYSMGIWISGGGSVVDTGSGSSAITYPSSYANNNIAITCSGTISNKLFKPMVRLSTESDATFAPYSNICPISGYDKIEVLSCGKNILDLSKLGSYQVTASGTMRYGVPAYLKAGTYTFSKSGGSATLYLTNVTDNYSYVEIGSAQYPYTFSVNANSYVIFRTSGNTPSDWDIVNAQLEEGSSATTYVPYNKVTSISESLGQTVYGATYYPREGKLSSNMIMINLKGKTASTYATTGVYISNILNRSGARFNGICSHGNVRTDSSATYNNGDMLLGVGNATIYWVGILSLLGKTLAEFNTWLANEDVWVCYDAGVGNYTEIQLTPHEISLLKDYAYVSTNGTSIALDYHNGELASLSDVNQLGETLNILGDNLSNRLKVKALNYLYSGATAVGTVYTVNNAKSVVFGLGDEDSFGGFSIFYVVGNQNICYNMTPTFNASNNTFSFLPTAGNSGAVRFMGIVFYTKK